MPCASYTNYCVVHFSGQCTAAEIYVPRDCKEIGDEYLNHHQIVDEAARNKYLHYYLASGQGWLCISVAGTLIALALLTAFLGTLYSTRSARSYSFLRVLLFADRY